MKARVKFNNEIIDMLQVGTKTHLYDIEDIEFLDNPQDYWEKLKHQYAGMAMQVVLEKSYNELYHTNMMKNWSRDGAEEVARLSVIYATALVEKLKNE